ncbi:PspC domain-containing protein [TM7 phylum sp. oral taxon 348]|jgi:membrane protein containing pspC domain|nr:PspC domain-containing protein [Candidatus Saccharibacteria bacterium]TWP19845.1 PspC domain-containing protein [TM7 phylum sp. oral taxon 348]UJD06746.1 MAG: PspC domain-containing protein [Candidatus Nanosynbacter sp. HMT-348_TM7c-JB]
MKEITRIHLAKTPYDIELDAKEVLQKYLSEIKQMMGSEDTMYEIEARMVELLGERGVQNNGIITMSDVEDLRSKMGLPKEFSDSESTEDSQADLAPSNSPAKRLMRDTDNAIFGGVCAGIAAYWGINPLWVRLLFIISPFITFGTALLVYIIIWISLPEAKTAAEKLQMRGEPVTLDSLKKAANNSESKYRAKETLAKILRICLALGLFFTTLGLLAVLVVGSITGIMAMPFINEFTHAQPWAWGLLISLIIAGIMAVEMFGVLTFSVARMKFTKAVLITLVITSVIGVLSIAGMVITGSKLSNEVVQDRQRLTKVIHAKLPNNVEGVKYVELEGNHMTSEIIPSSNLRVEAEYINYKGSEKPKIEIVRDGDTLEIELLNRNKPCKNSTLFYCVDSPVHIKIYGPVNFKNEDIDHDRS